MDKAARTGAFPGPMRPRTRPDRPPARPAGALPAFNEIRAEHVVPGIRALLEDCETQLVQLERLADSDRCTWETLMDPMEAMGDQLSQAWGAVTHLKAVKDTEDLRKAVEEVQPEQVKFGLRIAQSEDLYKGFKKLRDASSYDGMGEAQKRVIDHEILGAELAGIALGTEERERVTAIQQRLSELSTKFSNNVLDATKAFQRVVTEKAEVDGLPESALELAAQTATSKGHEGAMAESGPWVFTLDIPSYMPVMLHAKNRGLREELYREYLTRASSGETDNTPNIGEILQLRQEKAKLLGYDNFADVSMARKMATVEKAETLMEELRQVSYDAAVQDLKDVQDFAKAQGADHELKQWDITFW